MKTLNRRRGFTLIELLVVIVQPANFCGECADAHDPCPDARADDDAPCAVVAPDARADAHADSRGQPGHVRHLVLGFQSDGELPLVAHAALP